MRISVPAETRPGETRVAATPETVKKLAAKHEVLVQSGAGLPASVTDEAYVAAGAQIVSAAEAWGAEVILKVRAPNAEERAQIKPGTSVKVHLMRKNKELDVNVMIGKRPAPPRAPQMPDEDQGDQGDQGDE